jgi:hypothetical protein
VFSLLFQEALKRNDNHFVLLTCTHACECPQQLCV